MKKDKTINIDDELNYSTLCKNHRNMMCDLEDAYALTKKKSLIKTKGKTYKEIYKMMENGYVCFPF